MVALYELLPSFSLESQLFFVVAKFDRLFRFVNPTRENLGFAFFPSLSRLKNAR